MDAKKVLLLVMFFAVALQTKEDPNAEWAKKKIEEFKSSVTFSGLVPRDYVKGQDIEFTVDRLVAKRTQIPYDYYHLPFCMPAIIATQVSTFGDALAGVKKFNSLYQVNMLEDKECVVLGTDNDISPRTPPWGQHSTPETEGERTESCTTTYSAAHVNQFIKFIRDNYKITGSLDGMPAVQQKPSKTDVSYSLSYNIGFVGSDQKVYLNNHLSLLVRYTPASTGFYRIVGVEAMPYSVDYGDLSPLETSCHGPLLELEPSREKKVTWTYSVRFVAEETKWEDRFQRYYHAIDSEIHWVSLINSVLVLFLLSGMVGIILTRTIYVDILRSRETLEAQAEIDSKGWKLIHGDVFRRPRFVSLLNALVAFGVQTLGTALLLVLLSFLSIYPISKGTLISIGLFGFCLFGIIAGIVSGKFGSHTLKQIFLTAFVGPAIVVLMIVIGNTFIDSDSSAKLSAVNLLILIVLWVGTSLPLVFVGDVISKKFGQYQPPVAVNKVPRAVPRGSVYSSVGGHVLVGGLIAFGSIFIELHYIFANIWGNKIHYLAGFLVLAVLILIVTVAETAILFCYFQLCAENYHWQWRSFLTGASVGIYFAAYSIYYGIYKLKIAMFTSFVLYLSYCGALCLLLLCSSGAVAYVATRWFVHKLYSSIPFE